MGTKTSNIFIAYGCNVCHDIVDGRRTIKEFTHDEIELMHHKGVIRTQIIMIDNGVIKV